MEVRNMPARTITLPAEIVDRLETLARTQGRALDEVLSDLLEQYVPTGPTWALALAQAMEAADIAWQDEASLSARSRERFEQHSYEKWQRTQNAGDDE
jgi:predicted transcriptional regulator